MKEILIQLRKTYFEKKFFRKSPYKYYNFWKIEDPKKVWFSRFIEFHQINPLKKDINFISIFGAEFTHLLISSPKVFFSGEDLDSNTFPKLRRYKKIFNKMDLILGFDIGEQGENFYLPLWFLSFIEPDDTFDSISSKLDKINNVNFRRDHRKRFCSQIARHDMNGIREKIILMLKEIDSVDCAGSFMKNTDELKDKFENNKNDFLKNYKFNICPENSDTPGYTTEKIFDAINAGCIPIYWSEKNLNDFGILNKDAILFYDENNPEKLYNKVLELHQNNEYFEEFISRPIFTENAPALITAHLQKLKDRLKTVIASS